MEYGASLLARNKRPLAEARTSLGPATNAEYSDADSDDDEDNELLNGSNQYYDNVVSRYFGLKAKMPVLLCPENHL